MLNIAISSFKNRFLTFKNFLFLVFIFTCIQYLDEVLESYGILLETTLWDYLFDGLQLLFICITIYFILNKIEKNVLKLRVNDLFLRAVVENMDEGIAVCDKDGNLVFANDTYSLQLIQQKSPSFPILNEKWIHYWDFYEEDGKAKINLEDLPLLKALRGEKVRHQVIVSKPIGKPMHYHSVNGKQLTGKSGEIIGALVVIHDITEKKESEEKMKYMAFHDNLTGLPNLRYFKDKVSNFLDERQQNNNKDLLAVMFLDLDGFKNINDNFGHDVGDLLLIEASQRITACMRENDFAARIGGDEFTIILPEIKTEDDAIAIANTLNEKVGFPYDIQGNRLNVTTSIGIAFSPEDGKDRRTLMKNADIAMYTAKNNGKNRYCVFHDLNPQKVKPEV